MPLLVLLSSPTTSQPDYSLPSLILMAVYVLLTLVIAIAAIWSAFITRSALKTSSELSRNALTASDRQSREAIEAVQRQIEVSERQAQEALYNQHKPVMVPITQPVSHNGIIFELNTQNKGSGVALNTFGLLTISGLPTIMCTNKVFFLVPDKEETFLFSLDNKKTVFPYNVFEGYNVFSSEVRFLVTYNDAFSNRYLAVFDYSSILGWSQVDEIKRVEKRLDEQVIIKQ